MPLIKRMVSPERKSLTVLFVALNALDLFSTLVLVASSALEVNPIFTFLMSIDMVLFASVKIALSLSITYVIYKMKYSVRFLRFAVPYFAGLISWQIIFLVKTMLEL